MNTIRNLYRNNNTVLNDAFDRTVAQIHIKKQQNNYKSFIITGCEPGVGATTVAINLATAMASAGWKTLLIDADMRKKANDKRLNEEAVVGLSDYLTGKDDVKEYICATTCENLSYMGSGNETDKATSLICSVALKEMLAKIKDDYDYVIVDVPSINTTIDASVLATEVDATVLVAERINTSKKNVEKAYEQLKSVDANVLGIVVNRVDGNEYKKVMQNYDYYNKRKYKKTK